MILDPTEALALAFEDAAEELTRRAHALRWDRERHPDRRAANAEAREIDATARACMLEARAVRAEARALVFVGDGWIGTRATSREQARRYHEEARALLADAA